MQKVDLFEVKWNLEILGFDRGKKKVLHQHTHNVVVNNGRQFILENIAAASFGNGGFTRMQDSVIQYIGFGVGGNRQVAPEAMQNPLAAAHPTGYGGSNTQTDDNLLVSRLERPVKATNSGLWLKEVMAPPTAPSATSLTWTAHFAVEDLNLVPFVMIPISEIGLFSSKADPTQPNGGPGSYPGGSTAMVAYDTFFSFYKTGFWNLVTNWTWQI